MTKLTSFAIKPLAYSVAALALSACGGTGQDVGQAAEYQQNFSGVAIDGHLARAMVYFDYDNNGTRSAWEPFALTDNDGFYSFNPKTGADYCADAGSDNAIYCLRATKHREDVVIRVDGGYDVTTGEPFHGQLSRKVKTSRGEPVASAVISPLTSVVSHATSEEDKVALLTALGVTEADLDVDYFNSDGAGSVDPALFNTAVKLHKINTLMADAVEDQYRDVLAEAGTPDDMSGSVYRHIGAQLLSSNSNLDSAVTSEAFVSRVLQATEADARELFRKKDLAPPAEAAIDTALVGGRVAAMARVVDTLVPVHEAISAASVNGRARAIEALTIKNREDNSGSDTSIESAAAFFSEPANANRVNNLIEALNESDADLNAIVRNRFDSTDFDSPESIRDTVRLPAGATAFSNLGNSQLKVSDMNLGFGPNNLDDSEVEAYFLGGSDATEGRLIACIKHIDDASSNGKMGEASVRGERITGQWSLLNPDASDGSSYSVILTLHFLGAKYQAIMKPAGSETVDGKTMQSIRFDYAGEIRTWHSELGVQPQGEVPATSRDCENRLPSRIGLNR